MSCGCDPPGHLPAEGGQYAELLGACWGRGTAAPPRLLPSGAGGGAADKVRKVIAKHPNESTFPIQELCQLRGLPASLSLDSQRLAISGKHLAAMVGNAIPVPVLRILMGRALHVLLGCFSMRAPAQTHDASA